MKTLPIEALTAENFLPFGTLITYPEDAKNERFEILIQEEIEPWRIAILRATIREINRLECHPTSMETFEPMSGVGVLLVAEHCSPDSIKAFVLDQAVCLHKGVWHELISLSARAECKITENKKVITEFHNLPSALSACISGE